jgi:CRP-like cAMP-binding protein
VSDYLYAIIIDKVYTDIEFQTEVEFETVTYEPNEKILTKNVKYPYFCLLKTGSVRVKIKESESYVSTVVAELKEHDAFGEFGLFDDSPASADVIATTKTEIIHIDIASFLEYLQNNPMFCYTFSVKIILNLFKMVKAGNQKITSLLHSNLELQKKLSE